MQEWGHLPTFLHMLAHSREPFVHISQGGGYVSVSSPSLFYISNGDNGARSSLDLAKERKIENMGQKH